MKKEHFLASLLFFELLSVTSAYSQVQTFYVQSIQTDPGYSASEDSMAISQNTSTSQNKLFLFIGGTGSSSYDDYNALRYHSASLSNDSDSMAFDHYRQEIGFGTPNSKAVSVDSFNSIYTRTLKILQYLDANYPTQNWGQNLSGANSMDWSIYFLSIANQTIKLIKI